MLGVRSPGLLQLRPAVLSRMHCCAVQHLLYSGVPAGGAGERPRSSGLCDVLCLDDHAMAGPRLALLPSRELHSYNTLRFPEHPRYPLHPSVCSGGKATETSVQRELARAKDAYTRSTDTHQVGYCFSAQCPHAQYPGIWCSSLRPEARMCAQRLHGVGRGCQQGAARVPAGQRG